MTGPRPEAGEVRSEERSDERGRPRPTYRIQVRPDFDLLATAEQVDYLAALGVGHLYSAPLLAAAPGSAHGYDVVDHSRVNPELGGPAAFDRLREALREAGLGLVVDIVPNHAGVAVPSANPAWWDVLRRGQGSPYAPWFDIDWARGRIRLPVLADDPAALDDLKVVGDELVYQEQCFPIADGTGGGEPREVHDRQHYRLVSWRKGPSYRRFFAVSTLAGLRVEDPDVFDATHAEILRWDADGIRVDHPDGLRDPGAYLARLRGTAPSAWLLVEKILRPGERLPRSWPVDGTTGYDALGEVCGLFVDPDGEETFSRLAGTARWPDVAYQSKVEAATTLLATERDRLARLAPEIPRAAEALAELAACFEVYRSYLPSGARHLAAARVEAGHRRPDLTEALDAVTTRLGDPEDELAARFQQYTGAVMAKGVEDTAYYRYTRFVALNEVGGDPGRFGVTPEAFHRAAAMRERDCPHSMTTLSTHDTKRSEDVRARLAVLTEMPAEWAAALRRWTKAAPLPAGPDSNRGALALLLWQTVAGAWPIERERLHAYLEKAAREASVSTSWSDPDRDFEAAMHGAVDRAYDDEALRADITAFVVSITGYGWSNSLGQKLVQLAMPGVPDTYQGTELWDNSLVDPDNRRPVDFGARRDLLARLDAGWLPPVDETGAAKLLVTSRVLRARRDRPFTGYSPVSVEGSAAEHAVAFDRDGVVAVATRLPAKLAFRGGWGGTKLALAPGRWTDALTGRTWQARRVPLSEVLSAYPVALLVAAT
ncbi:malto-oligosyltrehalose synthase [Phytohabitans sp. ZYX-F-186]|uniref:Malto-oligosyltrehalose synthase n=1 Tax=Phytohabitans maris TaxID=3071409 RepID=A0ABU0ZSQ2_9ACTN|nr:malto-oligosyltrehalose synthase [Phytohabitans sp. ZYX-F-186]MDQ7909260.1 malto-oligosyltrehalose synthase [Phytohabitans sp. ZYX-F-186]